MRRICLNLLIITLAIGGISCEKDDDSNTRKTYISAGETNDVTVKDIKKTNVEYHEWKSYIDCDNDNEADIKISYIYEGGNNRDSIVIITPLNTNTQLSYSSTYETYISDVFPIRIAMHMAPGVDSVSFVPIFSMENRKWVNMFQKSELINSSSDWTNESCYSYLFMARDLGGYYTFDSLEDGYLGFRKVANNDTTYGWIDASINIVATTK